MTDAYTRIAKPTNADYVNLNVAGREQYDQASLTYNDARTFYDGVDMSAYTNVLKPISGQTIIRSGMTTGLVIPLTYATEHTVGQSQYTKIPKPTT